MAPRQLPYYLDEFTFRFNRRKSKSRGKLFFRLMQQAADTSPTTYDTLVIEFINTLTYLQRRSRRELMSIWALG